MFSPGSMLGIIFSFVVLCIISSLWLTSRKKMFRYLKRFPSCVRKVTVTVVIICTVSLIIAACLCYFSTFFPFSLVTVIIAFTQNQYEGKNWGDVTSCNSALVKIGIFFVLLVAIDICFLCTLICGLMSLTCRITKQRYDSSSERHWPSDDLSFLTDSHSNSDNSVYNSFMWKEIPTVSPNQANASARIQPNVHVPFLHYKLLECDNSGFKYVINGHDITVDIPQGAVAQENKITLEIGVAVSGPFKFPENARPISPILWIHLLEENVESELQKPLRITLPHCFSGLMREVHPQISAFKCDYVLGEALIDWKKVSTNLLVGEMFGALQTTNSGIYCIAMIGSSEFTDCLSYCLAQVNLPPSPPIFEFHFYGLLDLTSHKRALEQYLEERHEEVTVYAYTSFTFLRQTKQLELVASTGDSIQLEAASREIKASDIDFQSNISDHPPVIVMKITSNSQHSCPIKFSGCTNPMEFNLELSSDADLFEAAMQNGYVVLQSVVLLLIGVAGAGKTSFCHLIFDEPPPPMRESTPLAKSSIRAISLTKAIIVSDQEEVIWKRVSLQDFRVLIANAVKGLHGLESNYQQLQSNLSKQQTKHKTITLTEAFKKLNARQLWSLLGQVLSSKFIHEVHKAGENLQQHNNIIIDKEIDNSSVEKDDSKIIIVENIDDQISANISRLFDLEPVKQILELMSNSKGSVELFRQKWVYVIDSGGQPQFHELLPTFVHHVSAGVFFIKLNERLSAYPLIEYYSKDGILCGQAYKSSSTHMQILQNCLQAVQSQHNINEVPKCPELFFVGTHRDLEDVDEPIKSKNQKLISMLQQHKIFKAHLNYYSVGKSDQLLYPVNAKVPESVDKKVAGDFRQDIIRRCHAEEHKIPIRWFILELLLQHLSQDGVISFKECVEVAHRLRMDEAKLQAAIKYLVKLNIFEYFPLILPQVVFTTSQVLLNKVTELVQHHHNLRNGSFLHSDPADIKFRAYGTVTLEMLERGQFSSHYVEDLFEAKDLLYLWEKLLVVARGPNGNLVMPAVLDGVSCEDLSQHRLDISSAKLIPMAIHYPGGLFPSGIFSSLTSYLQNQSTWAISMKDNQPECLYKDCVAFNVSGKDIDANVTLIYFHDWIELHVSDVDEDEQKACSVFRNDLFSGLKHVQQVQKYDSLVPEIAFFCSTCQGKGYDHLASVTSTKKLQCRKETRKREKLTEKHQLWLHSYDAMLTDLFPRVEKDHRSSVPNEATTINQSTATPISTSTGTNKGITGRENIPQVHIPEDQIPLNEHNHSVLLKQLQTHSAKWREIGSSLGFVPSELDEIQARPFLLVTAPRSWLSAMLAQWLQWAPRDTRGSTSFAMLEDLKSALCEVGLTDIAHNLGIQN